MARHVRRGHRVRRLGGRGRPRQRERRAQRRGGRRAVGQRLRRAARHERTGRAVRHDRARPAGVRQEQGAVSNARPGYKEINLRALKLLKSGGTLVTCSCSHNINEAMFAGNRLRGERRSTQAHVTVIEKRMQGRDHPVLLGVPETYYLKCFIPPEARLTARSSPAASGTRGHACAGANGSASRRISIPAAISAASGDLGFYNVSALAAMRALARIDSCGSTRTAGRSMRRWRLPAC